MKTKKILSLVLALVMVASLAATLDITASAGKAKSQTSTYLDLESSTTDIVSSHAIDQNYNLTVSDGNYTDVTKVKVDWTISSIDATRTEAKIWDPDTLSWKDDTSKTVDEATAGTGTFTLTNLSSMKVNASVSFKAESGFNPTVTSTANEIILGTVVMSDKSVDSTAVHSGAIALTVTPGTDDFKTAASTTGAKYGTYTVTISTYVETESIVLSNDTLDLNTNTNKTATLTATVSPANATDNKVTWSSDNTAVATVDENGKVTAVGAGKATITATVGAKSTTCTVNVVAKIPVTNVSLNITELTLTSNDPSKMTATLIATVTPDNATDNKVTWSSSNTAVATVDANGNVTAVEYAHGKVDIKATADDVCATCTVTVKCDIE